MILRVIVNDNVYIIEGEVVMNNLEDVEKKMMKFIKLIWRKLKIIILIFLGGWKIDFNFELFILYSCVQAKYILIFFRIFCYVDCI